MTESLKPTRRGLLRGAAAYASGGREALLKLAGQNAAAQRLLTAMEGRKP